MNDKQVSRSANGRWTLSRRCSLGRPLMHTPVTARESLPFRRAPIRQAAASSSRP